MWSHNMERKFIWPFLQLNWQIFDCEQLFFLSILVQQINCKHLLTNVRHGTRIQTTHFQKSQYINWCGYFTLTNQLNLWGDNVTGCPILKSYLFEVRLFNKNFIIIYILSNLSVYIYHYTSTKYIILAYHENLLLII